MIIGVIMIPMIRIPKRIMQHIFYLTLDSLYPTLPFCFFDALFFLAEDFFLLFLYNLSPYLNLPLQIIYF